VKPVEVVFVVLFVLAARWVFSPTRGRLNRAESRLHDLETRVYTLEARNTRPVCWLNT
jgi:hypothetical protein